MRVVLRQLTAIAVSCVGLWYVGGLAREHLSFDDGRLTRHLTQRIDELDDAQAADLVRRLPLDSETGLRAIVKLAVSMRQGIVQEARRRLDDWLWAARNAAARAGDNRLHPAGHLVMAVAEELAANVGELGAGSRSWAERVSREFLALADAVPAGQRLTYLEHCDAILAAATPPSAATTASLAGRGPGRPAARGGTLGFLPAADERLLRYALQPGPLPGVPPSKTVPADSPSGAPDAAEQFAAGASPREDGPFSEPLMLPGPEPAEAAEPTAIGPGLAWRGRQAEPYARIRPTDPEVAETIDVPSPDAFEAREMELRAAPLAEALAALATDDPFEKSTAAAALRSRGMSAADLDFARRLHGADAAMRLRMLGDAASQPVVHLTAWLLHFAQDASADVRLRALSLLATSDDEKVLADVRAQALRDEDPRIRALADRLETEAGDLRSRK